MGHLRSLKICHINRSSSSKKLIINSETSKRNDSKPQVNYQTKQQFNSFYHLTTFKLQEVDHKWWDTPNILQWWKLISNFLDHNKIIRWHEVWTSTKELNNSYKMNGILNKHFRNGYIPKEIMGPRSNSKDEMSSPSEIFQREI